MPKDKLLGIINNDNNNNNNNDNNNNNKRDRKSLFKSKREKFKKVLTSQQKRIFLKQK